MGKKILISSMNDAIEIFYNAGSNKIKDFHFKGIDLTDVDFSGFDVSGCMFTRCKIRYLTNTHLIRCIFSECIIKDSAIYSVSFEGSKIESCNISGSTFNDCDFYNNNSIIDTDLSDTAWVKISFDGKMLIKGCDFSNSKWNRVGMIPTEIEDVVLDESLLNNTKNSDLKKYFIDSRTKKQPKSITDRVIMDSIDVLQDGEVDILREDAISFPKNEIISDKIWVIDMIEKGEIILHTGETIVDKKINSKTDGMYIRFVSGGVVVTSKFELL
jgi:hypothetical protein